jgi:hypothetical protein
MRILKDTEDLVCKRLPDHLYTSKIKNRDLELSDSSQHPFAHERETFAALRIWPFLKGRLSCQNQNPQQNMHYEHPPEAE